MAGPHTARARARALMIDDIKTRGLEQLVAEGAAQLSLRAIARDLGIVSSAIYRYYASRDELLTALIIDAYTDLATAVEAADTGLPRTRFRRRWIARATGLRGWALTQPQRFGLLYGTAVPGYRAPQDTVTPATAVITALVGVVAEAGRFEPLAGAVAPRSRALRTQLEAMAGGLELELDAGTTARAVAAVAELIGLLTLELGGHFVGGFEPADDLYAHCVAELADRMGLPG